GSSALLDRAAAWNMRSIRQRRCVAGRLGVAQRLDDPAVTDMHQVDAPNRSAVAEMETPADGGVVPHHDGVLDVEMGNRVGGKPLPEREAGIMALVSRAFRGWLDRLHDAVRRDQV